MKRTLVAVGALLVVLLLSGCGDDPDQAPPTPASTTATTAPAQTQGPSVATESPSDPPRETVAAQDVTEAQKKACLDAMVEQIRSKKGGAMPQACAILPDEVVRELVGLALSGG